MVYIVLTLIVLAAMAYVYRKIDARVKVLEAKIVKNPPQKTPAVVADEAVSDHVRKYHRGQ